MKGQHTEGLLCDHRTIQVQNAEEEPCTTAHVVVQNQIDFVPKVSVIIPVYNVEAYLRECLDSVVNQTLKEIEIICIDDGSTDDSLFILEQYAQKDPRIGVLRQENWHAGIARNAGLAVARGKYLSFLDADDFFEANMLEECYSLIEKEGSEILIYQYRNYNDETHETEQVRGINKEMTEGKSVTLSPLSIRKELMTVCNPMPWNKLICHQFIKDIGVRFQSQSASNDVYFSLSSLACSKKITFFYKPYVYYRYNRKDSLRNTRDRNPFDFYKAYEAVYEMLRKRGLYKTYQETFLTSLIFSSLWTLAHTEKAHREVKEFIKNVIVPKFIRGREALLPADLIRRLERVKYPDLIVSLTSYPARIETASRAIESLLRQSLKPDKLILWLAPEQFPNKEADLPQELLDLQNQGLTIDWCHDIGSYKKLIPTLKKYPDAIVVTADDDLIYHRDWLRKLYEAYDGAKKIVYVHRITRLYIRNGKFQILDRRKYLRDDKYYLPSLCKASAFNKLSGGAGALYPPHCFHKDVLDEEIFKRLAPTSDDIWFWLQALRNGYLVEALENGDTKLQYVVGTQQVGLTKINDSAGYKVFFKHLNGIIKYYPELLKIFKQADRKNKKIITRILEKYNALYKAELQAWYWRVSGDPFSNIENPKTFNEKIQWLKLYDSTPIKTRLADKYLVRQWIKDKIGEKYLIPLLGVYDRFEDIDFDKLPNQFVIKCNHGSGYNIIVKDKSRLDLADVKSKVDAWMQENFAFKYGFELHYRDIEPKILIEKYLEAIDKALYDYRFFCSYGDVKQIWLDVASGTPQHKRKIYDKQWNELDFTVTWPRLEQCVPKPKHLETMIKLAESLSQEFSLVRVDFYYIDNKIYFGEMTFTHQSGAGKFNPASEGLRLGQQIKLPELAYNIDTGEYYKKKRRPYQCLLLNWHKKHGLLKSAKSLRVKYILRQLWQMRIDIKNFGVKENKVSIQAENSTITAPVWLRNAQGEGCCLTSYESRGQIKIRIIKDGRLELKFMGPDKRFEGVRFPVWSDYKSIKIDGVEVLSSPVAVWHDESWLYKMSAKDGQKILVEYERQAHPYSREDLKETILRLNPTWNAIQENIDALTDEVYKIVSQVNNSLNEKRM